MTLFTPHEFCVSAHDVPSIISKRQIKVEQTNPIYYENGQALLARRGQLGAISHTERHMVYNKKLVSKSMSKRLNIKVYKPLDDLRGIQPLILSKDKDVILTCFPDGVCEGGDILVFIQMGSEISDRTKIIATIGMKLWGANHCFVLLDDDEKAFKFSNKAWAKIHTDLTKLI